MKIIFLDIDGVLNNEETFSKLAPSDLEIDDEMVQRLKQLVDQTGAKVVLSSSWRIGWNAIAPCQCIPCGAHNIKLNELLLSAGICLYDLTPVGENRGEEIQDWLALHPEVVSYVILDDEPYMMPEHHKLGRVVVCNHLNESRKVQSFSDATGFQEKHLQQALVLLQE